MTDVNIPPPPTPVDPEPKKAKLKIWAIAATAAIIVAFGLAVIIRSSGGTNSTESVAVDNTASQPSRQVGERARAKQDDHGGTTGKITAIDGSTITLKTESSDDSATPAMTVETSKSTAVTEIVTGTTSDLESGDHVIVIGTTTGNSVAATRIMNTGDSGHAGPGGEQGCDEASGSAHTPPGGGPGGGKPTIGTIEAVDGNTITVKTTAGTKTVTTTDATMISVTKKISIGDLNTGESIRVTGDTSGTTVTATAIIKGAPGGGPGGGPGMPGKGGMPGSGRGGQVTHS